MDASKATPADLASELDTASEAIRAANYATIRPGAVEVGHVYDALGALSELTGHLNQLCDQLASALTARHENGELRHDSGSDAGDWVAAHADAMGAAATLSAELQHKLRDAHNAISGISG